MIPKKSYIENEKNTEIINDHTHQLKLVCKKFEKPLAIKCSLGIAPKGMEWENNPVIDWFCWVIVTESFRVHVVSYVATEKKNREVFWYSRNEVDEEGILIDADKKGFLMFVFNFWSMLLIAVK